MKETDAYFFNYIKDNSLINHLKEIGKQQYNYEDYFFNFNGAKIAFLKKCDRDDEYLDAWIGLEKIAYLVNWQLGQKLSEARVYGEQFINCSIHSYTYGSQNKSILDQNIINISKFIEDSYGKDELIKVYDHILIKLKPNLFEKNEIIFYVPYFTNLKEKKEIKVIEKEIEEPKIQIPSLNFKQGNYVIIEILSDDFENIVITNESNSNYNAIYNEQFEGTIEKSELKKDIQYSFLEEWENKKAIEEKKRKLSFENLSKLSIEELKKLQENLKMLGFYQSTVDGIFGDGTLNAFKDWIKSKEYEEIYKEEHLEEIAKEAAQTEIAIKKREEEERKRKLLEENNRNDLLNEIDQLNQSIQELKNKILSINPLSSDLVNNNKSSSTNVNSSLANEQEIVELIQVRDALIEEESLLKEELSKQESLTPLLINFKNKFQLNLKSGDFIYLVNKDNQNFVTDLNNDYIYIGSDVIKICDLSLTKDDGFQNYSNNLLKEKLLKPITSEQCDEINSDSLVSIVVEDLERGVRNNIISVDQFSEISNNYQILHQESRLDYENMLAQAEKKKLEEARQKKENQMKIITQVRDNSFEDYAYISVSNGDICVNQDLNNRDKLVNLIRNNPELIPSESNSKFSEKNINSIFVDLKTKKCGLLLSDGEGLNLISNALLRDNINFNFLPIIIDKKSVIDHTIVEVVSNKSTTALLEDENTSSNGLVENSKSNQSAKNDETSNDDFGKYTNKISVTCIFTYSSRVMTEQFSFDGKQLSVAGIPLDIGITKTSDGNVEVKRDGNSLKFLIQTPLYEYFIDFDKYEASATMFGITADGNCY